MPRTKAPFSRKPSDRNLRLAPPAFELREADLQRLTGLYEAQAKRLKLPHAVDAETHAARAKSFAEAVVAEALWARAMLSQLTEGLTRGELLAELDELSRATAHLLDRLGRVSRDVDVLLDVAPRDAADALRPFQLAINRAKANLDSAPPRLQAQSESRSVVQQELVLRVTRILGDYGIPVTTTAGDKALHASAAILALTITGELAGIVLAETTWRSHLIRHLRAQRGSSGSSKV